MAKKIADELQNLYYTDRRVHEGFSDAISGRPATSHDRLLARLNDDLIDLRQRWKACSDEANRLRAENERLKALLREASGHVASDTGWSYDEPTGYLLDRIDAATAQSGSNTTTTGPLPTSASAGK